jgi:predicted esterase
MKKLAVLITTAAIGYIFWHLSVLKRWPKPPKSYVATIAAEISAQGEFNKGIIVSPDSSELAFPRSTIGGRALFLMDVKSGNVTRFADDFEAYQTYGYSPDGKFLLFSDFQRPGHNRLMKLNRLGALANDCSEGTFADVAWVDNERLCFTDEKRTNAQILTIESHSIVTNLIDLGQNVYGVDVSRSNTLTLISDSGVSLLSLPSASRQMLLENTNEGGPFWNAGFPPMWLRYCADNSQYLFCSWDKSNWRRLYRLKACEGGWSTVRVSDTNDHCYNGQWIQRGNGFAYVGNQTNHLFLAVRPEKPTDSTNLFIGGHVYGYTVSRDGDKIYAIASTGSEPLGVWEYAICEHQLRYVGGRAGFSTAVPVRREQYWVESLDGTKIPYYVSQPKDFNRKFKYPAIIGAPPRGLQFFQAWEMFSQFFANIGVFHIAVNHRGVDGYGRDYSQLNTASADLDIEAVYQEVIKNPNIDRQRVFLMAHSGGTSVISRTVKDFPGQWAGAIVFSGDLPSREEIQKQRLRVFAFVGDLDFASTKNEVNRLQRWAEINHIPFTAFHAPHTHHVVTDTDIDRQSYLALADFIFEK